MTGLGLFSIRHVCNNFLLCFLHCKVSDIPQWICQFTIPINRTLRFLWGLGAGRRREIGSFSLVFVWSCSLRYIWSLQYQFSDLYLTTSMLLMKTFLLFGKPSFLFLCYSCKAQFKFCIFYKLCSALCCVL